MDTVRAVRVSQGYRKYHERCNGKTSDPKCLPDPDVQFILRILLDIGFFGLGLACQAEGQSYHTEISTPVKAVTENPE